MAAERGRRVETEEEDEDKMEEHGRENEEDE